MPSDTYFIQGGEKMNCSYFTWSLNKHLTKSQKVIQLKDIWMGYYKLIHFKITFHHVCLFHLPDEYV